MDLKKDYNNRLIFDAEESIQLKLSETMDKFDNQKENIAHLRELMEKLARVIEEKK